MLNLTGLFIFFGIAFANFWGVGVFFLGARRTNAVRLMLVGAVMGWFISLGGNLMRSLFPDLAEALFSPFRVDFETFIDLFAFSGLISFLCGFTWQTFHIVADVRRAEALESTAARLTAELASLRDSVPSFLTP